MLDQSLGSHEHASVRQLAGSVSPLAKKSHTLTGLAAAEIILDISRLLSRVRFNAPTGVDRVEMAYAQQMLRLAPDRLSFAAVHPSGLYGRLNATAVSAFLQATSQAWSNPGDHGKDSKWALSRVASLARLLPRLRPEPILERRKPRVYLQVSPHHLDRPRQIQKILMRERARFVCLVHDLIPIEYPEHARPNGLDLHSRRMDSVSRFADAAIAASESTRRSLLAYLSLGGKSIDVCVAPLGAEPIGGLASSQVNGAAYFVFVGTIEPRKNHLLLLNLWRRMVEELGPRATPRLLLIGRRGWENENILDMLDRCPPLKGVVEERGHLSDKEMWPLVQGARALLMPSFAEGFGLPVIEALKLGVPVLCSDIPAHHEIADPVAEFLDPLDGPGWRRAILDYAAPGSIRREEQLGRMEAWTAPTWEAHVQAALRLVDEVGR